MISGNMPWRVELPAVAIREVTFRAGKPWRIFEMIGWAPRATDGSLSRATDRSE